MLLPWNFPDFYRNPGIIIFENKKLQGNICEIIGNLTPSLEARHFSTLGTLAHFRHFVTLPEPKARAMFYYYAFIKRQDLFPRYGTALYVISCSCLSPALYTQYL